MSKTIDNTFQLSGEGEPTGGTAYSLEQYLNSNGGVTERLLRELNVVEIVGRAQAVRREADRLAGKIVQPSQSST
ncbi:hypothetical protein N657DRAFT_599936 [Parathielavia appendiculata]|uniref:Uncharacterized protein n=1 Tax=Parathielavia appendiculata TaxID=2587402 RepID=A0AAN6TWJ4_9PEZI|nr:hypothetical protein N657DRAFT_599936 [Parathielavia appendiculata]